MKVNGGCNVDVVDVGLCSVFNLTLSHVFKFPGFIPILADDFQVAML